MTTIDFWFTPSSTHTYLTVMRLPAVSRSAGISFRWRPFYLRTLLQESKTVPFPANSAKRAYMWRDMERRAARFGIPLRVPAPYPLANTERAHLIPIVGLREGWGIEYIRAAYRLWFQEGLESGSDENLAVSLGEVGQNVARVLAQSETAETRAALAADTDIARSIGLFGSPSFVVGHEVFWGDDRLEDAIAWVGNAAPPSR